MYNKFTNQEAIAKVMIVRDDIRNHNTDKYKDMDFDIREEYTSALAQVINLAQSAIEQNKTTPKTGLDLFMEVLAERRANNNG